METILIIFRQILTMVLLSAVGYVMYRSGKITQEGSKTLSNILVYLSMPCVIINSFLVERTPQRATELLLSALIALLILGVSLLIAGLILRRNAVERFAGSFSNPGFFGAPLIMACLGSGGVFYVAGYISLLGLLQWTYGVSLLENSDEQGFLPVCGGKAPASRDSLGRRAKAVLLRLVTAPNTIAIALGVFFFLTALPVPSVIGSSINAIAALNTPIAMFAIGIYMAQTDLLKLFRKPRLYLVSLVRLLLIPAVVMVLLKLLPASMNDMKLALFIVAACPVGFNVAVYAQLHNRDYTYAVETVVLSTMLSILALPLVIGIAEIVLF